MKKSLSIAVLAATAGLAIGAGTVIAASGAPAVQGIYGYFAGNPVYTVALEASSGLIVLGCPGGQSLTTMAMANGGQTIYCK